MSIHPLQCKYSIKLSPTLGILSVCHSVAWYRSNIIWFSYINLARKCKCHTQIKCLVVTAHDDQFQQIPKQDHWLPTNWHKKSAKHPINSQGFLDAAIKLLSTLTLSSRYTRKPYPKRTLLAREFHNRHVRFGEKQNWPLYSVVYVRPKIRTPGIWQLLIECYIAMRASRKDLYSNTQVWGPNGLCSVERITEWVFQSWE